MEILDTSLLKNTKVLTEIDYWLAYLNWDNGWHYDLDIIWIIEQLEKANIQPGATILDAGAGMGVMQYILASRGYNVISLDFAAREFPENIKSVFKIKNEENEILDNNPYREFMKFDKSSVKKREVSVLKLGKLSLEKRFGRLKSKWMSFKDQIQSKSYSGEIKVMRASFNEIPLGDGIVDAVVSVSAFEHNNFEDNPKAVSEFKRVCKKGGLNLITTSFTNQKESWFHDPSMGWCFSRNEISKLFNDNIKGDYDQVLSNLKNNLTLHKRLSTSYKVSSKNGLPFGDFEKIQYVPIGILKKIL